MFSKAIIFSNILIAWTVSMLMQHEKRCVDTHDGSALL
jgi:hypothetical protein